MKISSIVKKIICLSAVALVLSLGVLRASDVAVGAQDETSCAVVSGIMMCDYVIDESEAEAEEEIGLKFDSFLIAAVMIFVASLGMVLLSNADDKSLK